MASVEVLAEESYRELLNLLEWFSHFSLIPTLIGGWAVFVYNSYFGSVDIDLVGPSMGSRFLDVVERYERTHGYDQVKSADLGIEVVYRKPIVKQDRLFGHVEIDVCTYEADTGSFHEDPHKKLPYALCSDPEFVRNMTFDEKLAVHVPKKSLLLLYKLKAFRDRAFDLKTRGAIMSVERRQWMQTKLGKDGADLIALLNPKPERYVITEELDFDLLKQLLEKQNLHFALESIKELPNAKESLERHASIEEKTIKKWVKSFFERLE
ncbi:MAG: hypothetical protein OEY31_09895 [Candidatus Bathyarchaeota archaeon]|nr:hypothetical protein [Candidatus Bathyarchaeota archaeon]